jgi:hypothetical protein
MRPLARFQIEAHRSESFRRTTSLTPIDYPSRAWFVEPPGGVCEPWQAAADRIIRPAGLEPASGGLERYAARGHLPAFSPGVLAPYIAWTACATRSLTISRNRQIPESTAMGVAQAGTYRFANRLAHARANREPGNVVTWSINAIPVLPSRNRRRCRSARPTSDDDVIFS